jgi:quercetin dioxygenase-like cupin family protein
MTRTKDPGRDRLIPVRTLWLAIIILTAAAGGARAEAGWPHLGEAFRIDAATPISELTAHPEKYFNHQVRLEGVIASACTQEGCFIEVVPEDGAGEGVVVSLPDLKHHFLTACAGIHAIVEGLFYRKVYPASRVLHWQGHSFREGKPVPDFSIIPRLSARAASISEQKGPVPPPGDIHAASTDRIDLGAMEFEAEGFGSGRKWLEPGEVVDAHSTGASREIIYCLGGSITVGRKGHPTVILHAGEMSYLPPGTEHELRNASDQPAGYLFVFAKAVEAEQKPHDH